MTNIHVVMRPVSSAGGLIPSGTIVDTSQWRNAARLLTQRYLRPATEAEAKTLAAKGKGGKNGSQSTQ